MPQPDKQNPLSASVPGPAVEARPFVSFAQNGEDVMLWRAFSSLPTGVYVDVGAHDPVHLSTTKAFYDRGWSGINIEPSPGHYRALSEQRLRDINLRCAVGDHDGVITFFEIPDTGLSTTDPAVAESHRQAAWPQEIMEVPLRTLRSILAEYPLPEVHFLKVDVEGTEEAVLRGVDFRLFRPWVVVVEATMPLSQERSDHPLRAILEAADYAFAFFDGINSFFVAAEHRDLLVHFDRPVSPLDGYVRRSEVENASRLQQEVNRLELEVGSMQAEIEGLQSMIQMIHRSFSWKLTGPLRRLMRLLRGALAVPPGEHEVEAPPNEDSGLKRLELSRQLLLDFTRPGLRDWGTATWDGLTYPGGPSSGTQRLTSGLCTRAQLESPAFRYWIGRLGLPFQLRRKDWEFAFILQTLYERGLLVTGVRGLGFAVGEEAIPALLASMGCEVVASDLDPGDARAQAWAETAQLATSLEKLRRPAICPEDDFARLVSYRHVDMNQIPSDLRDFDFTWSSCSFEHCGSIELGLKFVESQMACLKPGGIAVHTTEFNLTSEDETIEEGVTVIFRRRDIDEMVCALEAAGHHVEPVSYVLGQTKDDQTVDIFPYTSIPHLKLLLFDRYVSTSVALIVRKGD
jgi:FkbM family methyltransferase